MSIAIVVRGTASTVFDAECVTVSLSAEFEEPKSVAAHEKAVALQVELLAALKSLEAAGSVSQFSSDRIRTRSHRPTDRDGRLQPPVYHTSIGFSAQFVDFDALAPFMDAWAPRDGVQIGEFDWGVLPDNRPRYEAQVRAAALKDAVAKAQEYADGVGAGMVKAVVVADPGMLSSGGGSADAPPVARFAMAASAAPPTMEFAAAGVRINVSVDGRFEA